MNTRYTVVAVAAVVAVTAAVALWQNGATSPEIKAIEKHQADQAQTLKDIKTIQQTQADQIKAADDRAKTTWQNFNSAGSGYPDKY